MLTKKDIEENLDFLKKVIDLTYNNTVYSELKLNCKRDLAFIDNLAVSWVDEYQNVLTIEEQNKVMITVLEVFLIWFTQKNKLRTKAFKVKPTDDGDNTDNVVRQFKRK